ncbi:hypothetical protein [Streptomyces sp. NPDC058953]|uniref:hypothetical protein n=1 Tax=unclassified Streptomyces TaxID=2593676 RepID=UPI0036B65ECE
MDPNLVTLATTAGTSLVAVLVAEGWQQTRDGVVTVWRRFRPHSADEVEQALETSRTSALAAAGPDSAGPLEEQWAERFAALLDECPAAADDLRGLVDEWRSTAGGQRIDGGVRLEATARDNARVYQSARDQYITER